MSGRIRTLYVEDDEELAESAAALLERANGDIEVVTAHSGQEGLDRLGPGVDCVVSDYKMDGMDGLELLKQVREEYPDLPFLILTGRGSEAVASEAISAGATDYLKKRPGESRYSLLANRIHRYVSQRRSEHERRRQLEAIETAREGIGILSADGEFVYVNEMYADLYGYDQEVLVGEGWETVYSETERAFIEEEVCPALGSDGFWHGESVGQRADGSTFPVDQVVSTTGDDGFVCTVRDKTEKKENERQLAWENKRYRSLLRHTNDAVAWLEYGDEDPIIREANPAFRSLFEPEGEDIVDAPLDEVVATQDQRSRAREISRQVRAGEKTSGQLTRETVDGQREFLWEAIPLDEPDSETIDHMHLVYKDITKQRERQEELEAQNERLEQFRRVASHDLRNPLNVALTRLDLAKREYGDEHLEDIGNALDRMERLIDDLLLIAKGGDVAADQGTVELDAVAEASWTVVDANGATLEATTDLLVQADRSRLRQLFENLLANAVEHGQPDVARADVTITVGSLPDGFYIADDGQGIPSAEREAVFETGYSTDEGGTGFGLSIVSLVADAHGWEVSVGESDDGGARFEFTGVETGI